MSGSPTSSVRAGSLRRAQDDAEQRALDPIADVVPDLRLLDERETERLASAVVEDTEAHRNPDARDAREDRLSHRGIEVRHVPIEEPFCAERLDGREEKRAPDVRRGRPPIPGSIKRDD